jgi:hypothetical protein
VFRRITEPSQAPVRNKVDHTPRLPYSPIWYPGRENVTLSRRSLALCEGAKVLESSRKKKLGCFVPSVH